MTSIADGSVIIQTSSEVVPSTPSWFGERVRLARRRFGRYEVIDFLAILFGYAHSGERTLEAFYERLPPFAVPFMALFERDRLPARSTLSRFLAAFAEAPVEALRTLFLDDLLSRPLSDTSQGSNETQTGGLVHRAGNAWVVFDIDGTREAARQRALPQTEELPPSFRRLDEVCAAGYTGRKRGEVVRTRTVISQAHNYQWLGSFGAPRATDSTGRNFVRPSRPSVATSLPTSFRRSAPCSGSMGNMARGPCWRIWQASRS